MQGKLAAWHIVFAVSVLASAGCSSVAASVAGGGLLGLGVHSFQKASERTVDLPLEQVEIATRRALAELDIQLVDVRKRRCDKTVTRCDLEACLVGYDLIPLDVELERLTKKMTKVRVTAKRHCLAPEQETADEVLAHIIRAARR